MINTTNLQALTSIMKAYNNHEHMRGIISPQDVDLIRNGLQLTERDEISLRNLRDTVVMYFELVKEDMDTTSAFVHMIDTELWRKGCEI